MQQGDSLHQPLINTLLLLPITLRIELKLPTYMAEIICTPPFHLHLLPTHYHVPATPVFFLPQICQILSHLRDFPRRLPCLDLHIIYLHPSSFRARMTSSERSSWIDSYTSATNPPPVTIYLITHFISFLAHL